MLGAIRRAVLRQLPLALAGRLRGWRARRLASTFDPVVVEHTYGAGKLKVRLADPLSQGWYDRDWAELPEVAALRGRSLVPGARVFDLGAHQGVVAMMLAREVGPAGFVLAVEASAHNAGAAGANRDLNGLAQLEVLHAAVSDAPGKLFFNESLNGQVDDGTGAGGRVEVEAVTIDQLAARRGHPDVVFVDVEGAEVMALRGAAGTIAAGADFFVEVHVGWGLETFGGTPASILAHFPPQRFERLVRAEADGTFRPPRDPEPLFADRFFLLALRRG